MFLNSMRYKLAHQDTWTFLRFSTGHGDLKNVQIIPKENFSVLNEVLMSTFNEQVSLNVQFETVIQFHDIDGSSWSILRKPGIFRVIKDGETVDPSQALFEMEHKAFGKIFSSEESDLKKNLFRVYEGIFENGALESWGYGQQKPIEISIKHYLDENIVKETAGLFQALGMNGNSKISTMLELTKRLHDIQGRIKLIEQWLRAWGAEPKEQSENLIKNPLDQLNTFKTAKELAIMAEIHRLVTPLTGPSSEGLLNLEKEKAQIEKQISALYGAFGEDMFKGEIPNFELALEALCRVKAYGKLSESTRNLREYCEDHLDPKLKAYIAHAEHLGGDLKKLLEEIQSEQLFIESQKEIFIPTREAHQESTQQASSSQSVHRTAKTWFERFKSGSKIEEQMHDIKKQQDQEMLFQFVKKITLSIDQIVGKGVQLIEELPDIDSKHRELSTSLEGSFGTLAQKYAKAKEEWIEVAKKSNLSQDMDIVSLIKLAIVYSRFMILAEKRSWISQKIHDYLDRIQKLEKLIFQWRKVTDSQKNDPLDQPQLVIQEAVAVARYLDVKLKRFEHVKDLFSEKNLKLYSSHYVRAELETAIKDLEQKWAKLLHFSPLKNLAPLHPKFEEILSASLHLKELLRIKSQFSSSKISEDRKPSVLQILKMSQKFSESSLLGFKEWLTLEAQRLSPFRSIILTTECDLLLSHLIESGASLAQITSRIEQRPPEAPSAPRPTPTIQKSQEATAKPLDQSSKVPGFSSLGDQRPVSSTESLQIRAEKVLAMLNPSGFKDTSKRPRSS